MTWIWAVGDAAPTVGASRQLTAATGRRVTWRVDEPVTAEFSIDGRHDEAAEIEELATDLHVWRDSTLLVRGRIGPESDDIDASRHGVQFTAVDYRGMLNHRIVGANGRTFTGVDQGQIAWTLIDESQALSGGDWGITEGLGSTSGTTRDRTLDPGKAIGDDIAQMGRLDNGFEWTINPVLELDRYYPRRGADQGVVADYGGILTSVRRELDPAGFANSLLAVGSQDTTPVAATTVDIGTDPRGRWELSQGTNIERQATLNDRAPWLLGETQIPRPTWTVTFAQDRWEGPDHVWIGDTVMLVVRSGRLAIAAPHRLVELSVALGGDGDETVTAGLIVEPT